MKKKAEKRGLSPVIATVLLIAMVLAISLIVFLWFRSFAQESITKFGGTNIDLVCKDVQFDASYSSGNLDLSNIGNVPIYSFQLQIENSGSGSTQTEDITQATTSWPATGLIQGGTFSGSLNANGNKITLIPVLRGTSSSGIRAHVCSSQYGKVL